MRQIINKYKKTSWSTIRIQMESRSMTDRRKEKGENPIVANSPLLRVIDTALSKSSGILLGSSRLHTINPKIKAQVFTCAFL